MRLQCACHSIRYSITNEALRNILLILKNDFAEARDSHHLKLEYIYDDAKSDLSRCIPSYSCSKLRDADFVPNSVALGSIETREASSQIPFQSTSYRVCFHCQIRGKEFLNNLNQPGSSRWAFWTINLRGLFVGHPEEHWVLLCASCNAISSTRAKPTARLFLADLCDDCWRDLHPRWCELSNIIERRREDVQEEIDRI